MTTTTNVTCKVVQINAAGRIGKTYGKGMDLAGALQVRDQLIVNSDKPWAVPVKPGHEIKVIKETITTITEVI